MMALGVTTQAALAAELGVTPSSVTDAARRKQVPETWIYKVAYRSGVRAEWLQTGRGAKRPAAQVQVIAESAEEYGLPPALAVPVISWVQAGALRSAEDLYPYAGAAEDYIMVAVRGRHSFALRVRGDSMLPDFREGDMIVVDPELAPRSGDFVVAVADDAGEATFKRYLKKKDGEVLMPLNADYSPIVLKPEHRLVGKVVRMIRIY